MKATLLATVFEVTGGVAILLAVPAQGNTPVVKIHPEWKWDGDAPLVPQVEEEVGVPEPLDHQSVAPAKTQTQKQAARHHGYVVRRPNFFERLFISFINLQKHPQLKSSHKESRKASRGG